MPRAFILILICYSTVTYAQGPVDHMNQLSADVDQISKDTWDYIRKVARGRNANKIEKNRLELAGTLRSAGSRVSQLTPYEGDASLRDAYLNYLKLSYLVINDDYKRIVDMERIAEDSYDLMEAYILMKERVNGKMDSAYASLESAQDDFAAKYNVTLLKAEDTKLSLKLKNAGEVNRYSNKIYLIFFKSSFYEGEMVEALSQNRVGDAEQFRQTLELVSKEGMEELASVGNFKDDNTLKDACQRMLNFFHGEATKYIPGQIEFFAKKDRMETMTRNMEAKKKKDLTQADIDEYNQAVEAYNASINEYNETSEFLNKNRSERYTTFNKTLESFQNKFI